MLSDNERYLLTGNAELSKNAYMNNFDGSDTTNISTLIPHSNTLTIHTERLCVDHNMKDCLSIYQSAKEIHILHDLCMYVET